MRDAAGIVKLINLYRAEAKRLESEMYAGLTLGNILAWYSCKVSIADLYEELQALRSDNVARIRPNVDRRRRARKRIA